VSKVNIITPPDKLFNDSSQVLIIFPTKQLRLELQETYLSTTTDDVNVYYFDKEVYAASDIDWLLSVFHLSNIVIIDVDNTPSYLKDLLSYMISKPKTFWLTTNQNSVYNHISNNRIHTLNFLSNKGDNSSG